MTHNHPALAAMPAVAAAATSARPTGSMTVAETMGPVPLAMCPSHGRALLDLPVQLDAAASDAVVAREPGDLFEVYRNVAILPIRGALTPNSAVFERYLGWATYFSLTAVASALAENDDVAAVVTHYDTPGGMVLGLHGAFEAMTALAAKKPVHALVHPLCASAGYYLAAASTEITITPGSELGSIGTMSEPWAPVAPDMWGDQGVRILSSHAGWKFPDPTTDEGRAAFQASADLHEAAFLDAVAAGRGLDRASLPEVLSRTGNAKDGGSMFLPQEAVARGLADTIETSEAFMARIMERYAPKRRAASSARARAAAARARAHT